MVLSQLLFEVQFSSLFIGGQKSVPFLILILIFFSDGQWNLTADYLDWDEDHSIVARANFTNAQTSTGWMFLEVQTRESAPDQLQAQAAGIAEGYLTR